MIGADTSSQTSGSGDKEPKFTAQTPDDQLDTDAVASASKSRGVWYLRPQPRPYQGTSPQYAAYDPYRVSDYYTPGELSGAYSQLSQNQKNFFNAVAKSQSSRGTGSGLFSDLLQEASRQNAEGDNKVGPFDLAQKIALEAGLINEAGEWVGGAGSGGSGSYNGPVTTVTRVNDKDARLLVDSLASDILGRAATEDEFKRALSKLRATESANPSVSGGSGASQTNVSGLSAEGRNDAITRALLKEDGAKEFTLATKMMGLFDKALQGRPDAGQQ